MKPFRCMGCDCDFVGVRMRQLFGISSKLKAEDAHQRIVIRSEKEYRHQACNFQPSTHITSLFLASFISSRISSVMRTLPASKIINAVIDEKAMIIAVGRLPFIFIIPTPDEINPPIPI